MFRIPRIFKWEWKQKISNHEIILGPFVTGKRQNNSLSKTEVRCFSKQAFLIAALDAQGKAPTCTCQKDTLTRYLCYVNIYIHYTSKKCLAYSWLFPSHWGSSDEGSYSSSQCPLVDLCFCANSVLRSHLPCPSRLLHSSFMVILQPPYLCNLHICFPKAQPPKGITQESLILQPSQLFTKNQDLLWLCSDSDNLKWELLSTSTTSVTFTTFIGITLQYLTSAVSLYHRRGV